MGEKIMKQKANLAFFLMLLLSSCSSTQQEINSSIQPQNKDIPKATSTLTPFKPEKNTDVPIAVPSPVFLTGAGDISFCDYDTDDATASLLENVPGLIFTLGDTQYDGSTYDLFMNCFDKSWGKYKDRMIPVVGNHEYEDDSANGFYDYFANELDPDRQGYFSMDVGAWHIVVVNSQCDAVGGCDEGSSQYQWLVNDLEQDSHLCTLALWHKPRFATGYHGPAQEMDAIWRIMVDNDVELVLNGHEHDYERFTPMDAEGNIKLADGTRIIIVGTGGSPLRPQYLENIASVVYNDNTYGVLQLKLDYGTYTWEFIPVEGSNFSDSGRGYCQ
jgi:hypothetical protein